MRDLHIDRNLVSKALIVLSVIALLAGLVQILWPKPKNATDASNMASRQKKLEGNIMIANTDLEISRNKIDAATWKQPLEEIGPSAMNTLSGLARQNGLKLVTFRPQKAEELDGITELPFLVALEGSYPDIVTFIRNLEQPQSKLAVEMIQLNGSDGITDRANLTLGVVAFSERPVEGGKDGKTL